jgi:hypothetical protein
MGKNLTRALIESPIVLALLAKIMLAPSTVQADEDDFGGDDSPDILSISSSSFYNPNFVNEPSSANVGVSDDSNKQLVPEAVVQYSAETFSAYQATSPSAGVGQSQVLGNASGAP